MTNPENKNTPPKTEFENIIGVVISQAEKKSGQINFPDLALLVDAKRQLRALSVSTGEDFENKEFATFMFKPLILRTLAELSTKEATKTLSPAILEKAKVNLIEKRDELTEKLAKGVKLPAEELKVLEDTLFKSYFQIITSKITDPIILNNVGIMEEILSEFRIQDLVE